MKKRHFKNESHEVFTILIESFGSFYIHLKSEEKQLQKYQDQINTHIKLSPLDSIVKGCIILLLY